MEAARETMAYLRPVREQPTSIEKCYHTAVKRIKLPAAHHRVGLRSERSCPPVLASEEQLRLVFFNLIDNAIDALGDQPGHIEVRGRVVDDPLDQTRRAGSRSPSAMTAPVSMRRCSTKCSSRPFRPKARRRKWASACGGPDR